MFSNPEKKKGILSDIKIEMQSDEESKNLIEAEKYGEQLEDAIEKFKNDIIKGIQEGRVYSGREFPTLIEINQSAHRIQLEKILDAYLNQQEKFLYGRFTLATIKLKFQELVELVNSIRWNDDAHEDTKSEVKSFISFINNMFNKIQAIPTSEDEKKYQPIAAKLEQISKEFLSDLKNATQLGTSKPLFSHSSKWTEKILELKTKYQTKPYKLFELLEVINNDFKDIPPKIRNNINDTLGILTRETANFKYLYIDNNKALDSATQTTANGIFGTILEYCPSNLGKKSRGNKVKPPHA